MIIRNHPITPVYWTSTQTTKYSEKFYAYVYSFFDEERKIYASEHLLGEQEYVRACLDFPMTQ